MRLVAVSTFASLILVALTFSPREARATGEVSAIYTVDMQRCLEESAPGKALRSRLQGEVKKREAQLVSRKQELEREKGALLKQKALMSSASLAERSSAIEKRERELAREFDDQREEMQRMTNREMQKIVSVIDEVVKSVAAERKIELVLERDPRTILYVSPEHDLTKAVIDQLNEKKLGM